MGLKFRKSRRSIKILPGVRINTGKQGINSVSFGGKSKLFGATTNVNLKTGKTKSTYSIRNVGSFEHTPNSTRQTSSSRPSSTKSKPVSGYQSYVSIQDQNSWYQQHWIIIAANILFPPVGIPIIWLSKWSIFWKSFGTGAALLWLLFFIPS